MTQQITTKVAASIEEGLDFLLSHFSSPLFPRRVSTYESQDKQFIVDSKDEALTAFMDSSGIDCRINAFYYSTLEDTIQGGLFWEPDLLFFDVDLQRNNPTANKKVYHSVLKRIKQMLGNDAVPTVLHSGRGLHIIQPVTCPALEQVQDVKEFREIPNPSERLMRFCKDFLSNGKADKRHNPSFKSCLLRVPNTINSKNGSKVKILQKWNECRPHIPKSLIIEFRAYLIQEKINQEEEYKQQQQQNHNQNNYFDSNEYYEWIEGLLDTAIEDCRKRAIDQVLAPYLIVVQKKSQQESFPIIREWLDRCDKVQKLDRGVNYNHRIKAAIRNSQRKQIPPMRREKMMEYLNKII